jgi:hypothetical protein
VPKAAQVRTTLSKQDPGHQSGDPGKGDLASAGNGSGPDNAPVAELV